MRPSAFLFDLDGTLIDSERCWTRALVDWLADEGVRTCEDDMLRLVVGRSWLDIHASLAASYPHLAGRHALEDARLLRPYYDRLVQDPRQLVIPSSVDFFWRVAPLAPCAIVSGSSRGDVAAAARMCGIYDALAFVMGLEDYPRGKPHPDGYLLAAERLGVDPAACVVIEDSTAGVKAGHAAGMRVLGVNRSCSVPQDYSLCSWCVADLAQFDVASAFGGVPQN